MLEILEHINFIPDSGYTLLAGDFNAKWHLWGGNKSDNRGRPLEYTITNNFELNNKCLPTFETVNGRSWIDTTFASQQLSTQINSWSVLEENSESDHRYLEIEMFDVQPLKEKRLTIKGEKRVIDELESDRWMYETAQYNLTNSNQLEIIVGQFHAKLQKLFSKQSKVINAKSKRQNLW